MSNITKVRVNGTVYDIKDTEARTGLITKVNDAPTDGHAYIRKNGQWVISSGGGGGGGGNAQVMYYYQQPVNTATNAEIFRITSGKINTDTVVLECTFADPSYITSDVTWTSYEGYIAFTGTCTTATTANVTMAYKSEDIVSDRLMTLLWENPNPNSAFASQTISLDLSQYDMISVKSKMNTNASENLNHYIVTNAFIDGKAYCAFTVGNLGNAYAPNIFTRWFYPSVSGINFDVGRYKSTTTTASASDNGNIMVPQAIYGISKNIIIQSQETYTEYTLTKESTATNWTILRYHACKQGNIAFIQLVISVTASQNGSTITLIKLPEDLYPKYEFETRGTSGEYKADINLSVETNGEINVNRQPVSISTNARINLCYPTV